MPFLLDVRKFYQKMLRIGNIVSRQKKKKRKTIRVNKFAFTTNVIVDSSQNSFRLKKKKKKNMQRMLWNFWTKVQLVPLWFSYRGTLDSSENRRRWEPLLGQGCTASAKGECIRASYIYAIDSSNYGPHVGIDDRHSPSHVCTCVRVNAWN